ncbi:MAG: hypothetical protein ABMA25_13310 [Ilumatobacteraceae bacterium]
MSSHRLIPPFIARRVRWVWFAGLTTAVWMNRRDAARWLRFGTRSVQQRDDFDMKSWLTEARLRAAVTADPVLRSDPDFDDIEVHEGEVTVRTAGTANWDTGNHLDALRRVKGVAHVACRPRIDGADAPRDRVASTVPIDDMDATFD